MKSFNNKTIMADIMHYGSKKMIEFMIEIIEFMQLLYINWLFEMIGN